MRPVPLRSAGTGVLLGLAVLFGPCVRAQAGIADAPLPRFADGKQSVLVRAVPGVVKRGGLETDFLCTSFDSGVVDIGVEVFGTDGARLNDVTTGSGALLDVGPGQTVTIGTGGTAAFLESKVITLPTVAQGSARIIATSSQIQCVVLIVDGAVTPPEASATITTGVQPSAGAVLSLALPRFSDGKPATHAMLVPGVVNRGSLDTDFFCTSLAAEPIDIGVEIFGTDGGVLNSVEADNGAVLNVQPGQTVTLGTTGTAAFLETAVITAPGIAQGLARVVSTSERVICSAVVLDSTLSPPTAMSELLGYSGVVPVPVVGCTGDCSGDGHVTVDELLTGVEIVLGSLPMTECPELDVDHRGSVSVNELVRAVTAALNGCVQEGVVP